MVKNLTHTFSILLQIATILGIWQIGEWISSHIPVPVPGSIMGLLILLILMIVGIVRETWISETGDFILKHIQFLFIPPGVAILEYTDLLVDKWLPMVILLFFSVIIVMTITGRTVQYLIQRKAHHD